MNRVHFSLGYVVVWSGLGACIKQGGWIWKLYLQGNREGVGMIAWLAMRPRVLRVYEYECLG